MSGDILIVKATHILTYLVNGSEVHVQDYVQFVLHCGDYNCKILANVLPNLQQELILGIPSLIKANPTIDWCCALCPGVVDWHNCGIVLGALESGLGIGSDKHLYSVTFYVGMGPL